MFIFAFVIGMMAMANTIEKKDSQTLPEVTDVKSEGQGVCCASGDGCGEDDDNVTVCVVGAGSNLCNQAKRALAAYILSSCS